MGGKQMEGDNERRRKLARQAREQGHRPSEVGATLGASKQPEHVELAHSAGPPPVPGREWPRWNPAALGIRQGDSNDGVLRYRELVTDVVERTGSTFDEARTATEAAVTALVQMLPSYQARELLDAVPAALLRDHIVEQTSGQPPERARYHTQAVLSALADRDPELFDRLHLPPDIRELAVPPPIGGGTVDADGHVAALSDDELRTALRQLPEWSGDRHALTRTIELPPDNLERVLDRLEALRHETGRAPHIGRLAVNSAIVVVRTSSIGAVSHLDVPLAHRVDAAIDEAGAGMSAR